ncbi:hypothetical protein [Nostocoides sp.]|uniref:hypothetical protein n=1 Tax=Nostocoides sp. TaxID=1917966 RepID=UPI003BB0FED9
MTRHKPLSFTQHNVAALSDHDLKRGALRARDLAQDGGPLAEVWWAVTRAWVFALRERRATFARLMVDMENPDEAGALVTPDNAEELGLPAIVAAVPYDDGNATGSASFAPDPGLDT